MNCSCIVESLETRSLLSATVVGNALRVQGTRGNDRIYVDMSGTNFVVSDSRSPKTVSFPAVQLVRIEMFGLGGNDILGTRTPVQMRTAFYIDGGAGNDQLLGGSRNDSLVGMDGADTLYGQHGNDILMGRNGNDVLWGGNGNDGLDGGAGNDLLRAGAGRDTLVGHVGKDSLYGDAGDDDLRNYDGDRDFVFGGAGNDTADPDPFDTIQSVEHRRGP